MPWLATLVKAPPAPRKKKNIKRADPTAVHHEVKSRKCVLERMLSKAAPRFVS
jgi:hypothetical protein